MKTGLVSITFRELKCEQIIALVKEAGLDGIEWGGDIHVPHGDMAKAVHVQTMMSDAGLVTAAYGSYYRLTNAEKEAGVDEKVLSTAAALRAPLIRVWAGTKSPLDTSEEEWMQIAENAEDLAIKANREGIQVAFEFHGNTLTENTESACKLLSLCPHMLTLWQPPVDWPREACLRSIQSIRDRLTNVHVFSWDSHIRLPLADKKEDWLAYCQAIGDTPERYLLLEFVKDNSPKQFLEDAETLKSLLA